MKFRQSFWSHLTCSTMCTREINWSRANIFLWGNNQMLHSTNELVSDRIEPAGAECSEMVHSANSSEHRKVTSTLKEDELEETLL